MKRRIRFVFKEDGTVQVDAEGFVGSECIVATDKLIKSLEPELLKREFKREFYVAEKSKARASVQR